MPLQTAEIRPYEPGRVMLPREVSLACSVPAKLIGMTVFLNQKACLVESGNSLLDLLTGHKLAEKKGIAVAINNEVIPRTKWHDTSLSENDKVIVITATQGG